MAKNRTLKIVALVGASIAILATAIIFLLVADIITLPMAILMLVALLGLYVGFGILIAVYRLIQRME